MPKFKVDKLKFLEGDRRIYPPDKYVLQVIWENNNVVTDITQAYPLEALVVECENKPRNMPIFSIYWLDVE